MAAAGGGGGFGRCRHAAEVRVTPVGGGGGPQRRVGCQHAMVAMAVQARRWDQRGDSEPAPPEVLAWDLGAGETQVVTHALRHGTDRVVLDCLEARRCAKAMGLGVTGTLGVVGRAKALGQIAQAAPVTEHLGRTGLYVSDALVQHLLRQVGE